MNQGKHMSPKTPEQATGEGLLIEMRRFTAVVAKLEALVPRIEKAINDQIVYCREDMSGVYGRLKVLEDAKACAEGRKSVHAKAWYKDPHWWHNIAVWVGMISMYFGLKGGGTH
jgi:hypothetical protein